jgi:hypothetical protein
MKIPKTDLRSICRERDKYLVTVNVKGPPGRPERPWLLLGEANLEPLERMDSRVWWLKAYLGARSAKEGVPTDFEHDSAYVCRLPLIGVEMRGVRYNRTVVSAWVESNDPDDFHVPLPGYDPRTHERSFLCEEECCTGTPTEDGGGAHIIVPEGFYVPPFEPELFEAVKGQQVEIVFSIPQDD